MFKKIALALVVAVVGFGAFVASRPSKFRVERSLTMASPADLPFGLVNDFHGWHHWSPWEALDPKMQKTFDGPYAGPGSSYAWSGNKDVGKGKMVNLEAKPYESVRIQLEFIEPFPASNISTFTFKPEGENVTVTWAMEGENNFMSKLFGVFIDIDTMVGKDFDKGLATIKSLVEPEAIKRAAMAAKAKADAEAKEAAAAAQPAEGAAPAPQAGTTTP
ncbi:SRPBCC family protein [Myxococcaceae bacterium GXIMD 01537]